MRTTKVETTILVWFPIVCLFVLRLNIPVNNFSVMSGRSHRFLGTVINQYFRGEKCLAQRHNMAAVGFEPPTSRSRVRHSTTEPPRSPVSNSTPTRVEHGMHFIPLQKWYNIIVCCHSNRRGQTLVVSWLWRRVIYGINLRVLVAMVTELCTHFISAMVWNAYQY